MTFLGNKIIKETATPENTKKVMAAMSETPPYIRDNFENCDCHERHSIHKPHSTP